MKPLDCLHDLSTVEALLRSAPAPEVHAELERLAAIELAPVAQAARAYAEGALALREGRLDHACDAIGKAVGLFAALGNEPEATALAACEHWLARIRRGPRSVFLEAADALGSLASEHDADRVVTVVALHYRGTALRYAGQAEATLTVLLDAFARSDGLLAERAQVLNSLGTLYVVLGAYGAAHAVLEHAAELNHQIGDRVGEAISYGQLGSAALALGELETARKHLQRQEWLATTLGDAFGRSRALTLLADLAIDLGRPDDALTLGEQARSVATSVVPPLAMWVGYSGRTIARAKLELGDAGAGQELEAARDHFRKIGNQLGEAMVEWDLARHASRQAEGAAGVGRSDGSAARAAEHWLRTAWSLGTLGLTGRLAQVLRDLRALAVSDDDRERAELAVAAVAQAHPHLSAAQEVELVYDHPAILAKMATRRIEGQRNLGRQGALTLAPRGLWLAALVGKSVGAASHGMPSRRAAAALLGQLPSAAIWMWAGTTTPSEVARDLSSFRATAGEDCRAAVGLFPAAKVLSAPFAGEPGALLDGAEIGPMLAAALQAGPGSLQRLPGTPWDAEAEALARMSGYAESAELPAG